MYLAVIDVPKKNDKGKDNHSSKNIALPLVVERRLQILNKESIGVETRKIRVQVAAEAGFDPHTDMDVQSLRFGASEEVDYGRGSSVLKTRKKGKDLILIFDGFDVQFVIGLDKTTGKTVWKTDRNIDYGTDDGDFKKAFSTIGQTKLLGFGVQFFCCNAWGDHIAQAIQHKANYTSCLPHTFDLVGAF